jgi:hypothetical protein
MNEPINYKCTCNPNAIIFSSIPRKGKQTKKSIILFLNISHLGFLDNIIIPIHTHIPRSSSSNRKPVSNQKHYSIRKFKVNSKVRKRKTKTNMKSSSSSSQLFLTLLVAVVVTLSTTMTTVNGFKFMSKLKMPTYDPNEELVKEKFGDRSTYQVYVVVVVVVVYLYLYLFFVYLFSLSILVCVCERERESIDSIARRRRSTQLCSIRFVHSSSHNNTLTLTFFPFPFIIPFIIPIKLLY